MIGPCHDDLFFLSRELGWSQKRLHRNCPNVHSARTGVVELLACSFHCHMMREEKWVRGRKKLPLWIWTFLPSTYPLIDLMLCGDRPDIAPALLRWPRQPSERGVA